MAIPGNFLSAVTEMVDPDTSGWRARTNATISLGSGGLNGPGTLIVRATASGEFSARTAVAYPVVPGIEYYTFADASGTSQPERIGIEWLDASLNAVGSITWSLTTAAASATWHRISVAGAAPAGATQARVVLDAMAATANVVQFFDNIYLGPPKTTPGNMFGFNIESGKEDGSAPVGWVNDTNASIGRAVPVTTWPPTFYLAGGHVITVTASANGNASARQTTHPAVTPGVDYAAYAYLSPPTTASSTWIEMRWLNASGTSIGTARAVLAAPGTGFYRQYVSGVAPSGAVSVELAVGITSATAGQVLSLDGVVLLPSSLIRDPNQVPLADADFESGTGAWSVSSGVATIARSSPWGSLAFSGSYSMKVTSSTATASTLVSARYPVTDTGSWRAQVHVQPTTGGTWQVSLVPRWYDASGTVISAPAPTLLPLPPTGGFYRVRDDFPPPAGAATARIEVGLTAPAAGATAAIDTIGLFPSVPDLQVTANDALGSTSIVMRELTAGDTLDFYRVVGSTQTLVRGPDGFIKGLLLTSTQLVFEDYEAPIGQPFSYNAVTYSAPGVQDARYVAGPFTINVPDPSDCWIKDPLQPERNVLLRASVAPDWSRPIEQTEYRIRGRRNSVILSDVRGGLTGTVQVWTMSDAERQALHFALDSGSPLLFQFEPQVGLEDAYYIVGDITEARWSPVGSEPRRIWSLALTQVDAPVGGVSGTAGWTVQDVLSTWDTVLDVANNYATVLDLAIDNREV